MFDLVLTAEERHEGFMALSTLINRIMTELRSNPEALEAVLTGRRGLLVRGGTAANITPSVSTKTGYCEIGVAVGAPSKN